jgi:hypothetical protein
MRRAAWRTQGGVVLRPEDVRDDWARQALINEANRLYGRRPGRRPMSRRLGYLVTVANRSEATDPSVTMRVT